MIFIVEDDPTLNRLVGDYFVTSGHEVERFTRAEDALASAKTAAPDVVITDVQLPGMSGNQTMFQLKGCTYGLGIEVLFGVRKFDAIINSDQSTCSF